MQTPAMESVVHQLLSSRESSSKRPHAAPIKPSVYHAAMTMRLLHLHQTLTLPPEIIAMLQNSIDILQIFYVCIRLQAQVHAGWTCQLCQQCCHQPRWVPLCSGGKAVITFLWDSTEGKRIYSLDTGSIIHALCFSPNRYWLCASTVDGVKIWDLESKKIVHDLKLKMSTNKTKET